jgi:hypothetical protein
MPVALPAPFISVHKWLSNGLLGAICLHKGSIDLAPDEREEQAGNSNCRDNIGPPYGIVGRFGWLVPVPRAGQQVRIVVHVALKVVIDWPFHRGP